MKNILAPRSYILNAIFHRRSQGALEEWLILELGQENTRQDQRTLWCQEVLEVLRKKHKDEDMSKGPTS